MSTRCAVAAERIFRAIIATDRNKIGVLSKTTLPEAFLQPNKWGSGTNDRKLVRPLKFFSNTNLSYATSVHN